MDKKSILNLFAEKLCNNTIEEIFDIFSSDCIYLRNGSLVLSGKKSIQKFFKSIQTSCINIDFKNFATLARITESSDSFFPVDDFCLAMAQADEYNCTGILNIHLNSNNKINRIYFSTNSEICFEVQSDKIRYFSHMPINGHEAIRYRALATELPDPNNVIEISEEDKKFYDFLIGSTVNECLFNYKGKAMFPVALNAAAYILALSMAKTIKTLSGRDIFIFDEKSPVLAGKPVADAQYQEWIDQGYESGKWLFFGFTEYVDIRNPDSNELLHQFKKCLWDLVSIGIQIAEEDFNDKSCISNLVSKSTQLKSEFLQYFKGVVNNDGNHVLHAKEIQDILSNNIKLLTLSGESKPGRLKIVTNDEKMWLVFFTAEEEIPDKDKENAKEVSSDALLDVLFFNPFIDGIIIDPFSLPLKIPKKMLIQCLIHGTMPKALPPLRKQTDLPQGIPEYTKEELITEQEINSIAFQTICVKEIQQDKSYTVVSFNDKPGAIPGLILENNGKLTFVYIKGHISKRAPNIPKEDAEKMKALSERFNAECAYATVKIYSVDPERAAAGIALSIDKYYCRYRGLKKMSL